MKRKWTLGLTILLVISALVFIIGVPNFRSSVVAQFEFINRSGLELECVNPSTSTSRVALSSEGSQTVRHGIFADGARVLPLDSHSNGASIQASVTQNQSSPVTQCWSVRYKGNRPVRLLDPPAETTVSDYVLPLNTKKQSNRRNIIKLSNQAGSGTSRVSLKLFASNGSEIAAPASFTVVAVESDKNINLAKQVGPDFVGSVLVSAIEGSTSLALQRDAGVGSAAFNFEVPVVVGIESGSGSGGGEGGGGGITRNICSPVADEDGNFCVEVPVIPGGATNDECCRPGDAGLNCLTEEMRRGNDCSHLDCHPFEPENFPGLDKICVPHPGEGNDRCGVPPAGDEPDPAMDCVHSECESDSGLNLCAMLEPGEGPNECGTREDCGHYECGGGLLCNQWVADTPENTEDICTECPSHLACSVFDGCIFITGEGPNQDSCTEVGEDCEIEDPDEEPTDEPTSTTSSTETPTVTTTPTLIITPTPVVTPTPIASTSPSISPSVEPTPSFSPSPTESEALEPLVSPSLEPTASEEASVVATVEETTEASPTSTAASFIGSSTPTDTATPTLTVAVTPVIVPTPVPSPTILTTTPTPFPSPSPSSSITVVPTPTISPTETPTPTIVPTSSGSPSSSPSTFPSPDESPTVSTTPPTSCTNHQNCRISTDDTFGCFCGGDSGNIRTCHRCVDGTCQEAFTQCDLGNVCGTGAQEHRVVKGVCGSIGGAVLTYDCKNVDVDNCREGTEVDSMGRYCDGTTLYVANCVSGACQSTVVQECDQGNVCGTGVNENKLVKGSCVLQGGSAQCKDNVIQDCNTPGDSYCVASLEKRDGVCKEVDGVDQCSYDVVGNCMDGFNPHVENFYCSGNEVRKRTCNTTSGLCESETFTDCSSVIPKTCVVHTDAGKVTCDRLCSNDQQCYPSPGHSLECTGDHKGIRERYCLLTGTCSTRPATTNSTCPDGQNCITDLPGTAPGASCQASDPLPVNTCTTYPNIKQCSSTDGTSSICCKDTEDCISGTTPACQANACSPACAPGNKCCGNTCIPDTKVCCDHTDPAKAISCDVGSQCCGGLNGAVSQTGGADPACFDSSAGTCNYFNQYAEFIICPNGQKFCGNASDNYSSNVGTCIDNAAVCCNSTYSSSLESTPTGSMIPNSCTSGSTCCNGYAGDAYDAWCCSSSECGTPANHCASGA